MEDEQKPIQVGTITDYLFSLAQVLQSAKIQDKRYFQSSEVEKLLEEFVNNILPASIYMTKFENSWQILSSLDDVEAPSSVVIIIKDKYILSDSKQLDSQIQVINLPNITSCYETLRLLVNFGVGSYFEATAADNKADSVSATKKKIKELALSLQHLEQVIKIPDLTLTLSPIVRDAVNKGCTLQNYTEFIPEETLTDTNFLNSIQNVVNGWVTSIQLVTRMSREVSDGQAADEINFWLSMESTLLAIQDQLELPGVQLSLEVLKYAKRYHATVSFISDIGIQNSLALATDYNKLMRDFPLNELLSATTFEKIEESITLIFNHLKRIRLTSYPVSRALSLVEAISANLDEKLKSLIGDFMSLEFHDFKILYEKLNSIFAVWDRNSKEFTNIARESMRRRNEKFIFVKINSKTTALRDRLEDTFTFRSSHNQLESILSNTKIQQNELDYSYDAVRDLHISNTVKEWEVAKKLYDRRIHRIEDKIVEDLRETLDNSKNSNETFQVFEKYRFLLQRTRIRAAIQEYQAQLLEIVRKDINELQESFIHKKNSDALIELRDFGPISYTLKWAKETENKLDFLTGRLSLVLGKEWNQYAEGQKIFAEVKVFKKKLDTTQIFENWLSSVSKNPIQGNILRLTKQKEIILDVNFDKSTLGLFKEVRSLSFQKLELPHVINLNSRKVQKVYPHAVILEESLSTLPYLLDSIESLNDLTVLISNEKLQIFDLIRKCNGFEWESLANEQDVNPSSNSSESQHSQIISTLENSIFYLGERIELLAGYRSKLAVLFQRVQNCSYSYQSFHSITMEIQGIVNQIVLDGFYNIRAFITLLNGRLAKLFLLRFIHEKFIMDEVKHTIIIGTTISLEPPVESTKFNYIQKFQEHMKIILQQELIAENTLDKTNTILFSDHQENTSSILAHYNQFLEEIGLAYDGASVFVDSWFQYETLWSFHADDILKELTLDEWLNFLDEVRSSRQTFETFESVKKFGSVIINYQDAKNKIVSKFSAWNWEILQTFAIFFTEKVLSTDGEIVKGKTTLQSQRLNLASVDMTMELITLVEHYKTLAAKIGSELPNLKHGQGTLTKQRYKFPPNFMYYEQIEADYNDLQELIEKRSKSLGSHRDVIVKNLEVESRLVEEQITVAVDKWNACKPTTESIPEDAINVIESHEILMNELQRKKDLCVQASHLLMLSVPFSTDLKAIIEELADLKSVWMSVQGLWKTLDGLRRQSWYSIKPRALRSELEAILVNSRTMPVRIRQHKPFQNFLKTITELSASHQCTILLKDESIKERHIRKLFSVLGKQYNSKLSVGDIWDLHLSLHLPLVHSLIDQASSEKVLEDILKSIKETWSRQSYSFFVFNNQTLVKNFPLLIEEISSNVMSLSSMRNSEFFKVFEKDITQLESDLSKVYQVLNLWVEVQRQWMDLDGVFNSKSEVRKLLPSESSRFQTVSNEFITVLKNIYKIPLVLEILSIPDVYQVLMRISESLLKISKALSDFLEKQRQLFPRLYFVGNSDLLEMIATTDISKIGKHLKKMFAGVSAVTFNTDISQITDVISPDGEVLKLLNSVSTISYPRLDQWLSQLDYEIKSTLSHLVEFSLNDIEAKSFEFWLGTYPVQISLLTLQIIWTKDVESAIPGRQFAAIDDRLVGFLRTIAERGSEIRGSQSLIIELVHQRDVLEQLKSKEVETCDSFWWKFYQSFHYDSNEKDVLKRLTVKHLNKQFTYGFEYFGVAERLVYTPLLNRCFLAMTNALDQGLGGAPFGPAGTGKTETVKALGQNLGKFVLVFNCDESFDFQAMGRLLLGICQVGAWGCFDEFNRLDKNILSAVSSQLEHIESGLQLQKSEISLLNRSTKLNLETGIFVTMNPTYSGRAELPENLKKLFRNFSMERADATNICTVLLIAQGFQYTEVLAEKIVTLFTVLRQRLSSQKHYDFGLRALKSTLQVAGTFNSSTEDGTLEKEKYSITVSLDEMILPRLVSSDIKTYQENVVELFGKREEQKKDSEFDEILKSVCKESGLSTDDNWLLKIMQMFKIQQTKQGVMLVGKSGSGKTTLWSTLLKAFSHTDETEPLSYVIDPKVLSKIELFGYLDPITRDWTDGVMTSILRNIIEDLRGEQRRRTWIVFDGDVDPIWVESMNSVLDDNKILTLPNGERLEIPSNVRFIFEVDSLEYATPATVSRCGMVWIEETMVPLDDLINHQIHRLSLAPTKEFEYDGNSNITEILKSFSSSVRSILLDKSVKDIITTTDYIHHVMDFDTITAIRRLFVFVKSYLRRFLSDTSSKKSTISKQIVTRWLMLSLAWTFSGDSSMRDREAFSSVLMKNLLFADSSPELELGQNLLDFDIDGEGSWVRLLDFVESQSLDPSAIVNPNTVIPTIDTLRHENIIYALLAEGQSLIMCGPPGSGKTMTLYAALSRLPNTEVSNLNFSKETMPLTVQRAIEQHCVYKSLPSGLVLKPKRAGKRLVLFCDEINLPKADQYKTQKVISFLRQLIEKNGFWRSSDKHWVTLEDVQFVGACNPPSDTGRLKLTPRLLSKVSLVMVDYPGKISLEQIYETFNAALLKCVPTLSGYSKDLTKCMLQVYLSSQEHFTQDQQPHYVYSPRELTRWVRGMYSALKDKENLFLGELIRLWAHEGIRLFNDRLTSREERDWSWSLLWDVADKNFPNLNLDEVLKKPILYSEWLSLSYEPVQQEQLSNFLSERLKVFSEEILDINIALHDDAVEHILRIDRVLKQPQGHLMLVGPSGSGKTMLTKFVSWINGLKIYQLTVNRNYNLFDFDATLKDLMKRAGLNGEKICFIVDESTILDSAFLERMNSLLANSQIQEIFDSDEYRTILGLCKEQAQLQGYLIDSEEELYGWFTQQIAINLHVVFTIDNCNNPKAPEIVASSALFNRCVLNWMGSWSKESIIQVAQKTLYATPLENFNYSAPKYGKEISNQIKSYRDAVIYCLTAIHCLTKNPSPKSFVDFILNFIRVLRDKEEGLQGEQKHLNNGLDKLRDTVIKVKYLKDELSAKAEILKIKELEAKTMLNKILSDQNEAERKQEASLQIQAALERQEREIDSQRNRVMDDLALAEPAVLEARRGVKNIKKQHLTELRSMSTPPSMVQLTLESVCVLLGYEFQTWRDVQLIIRKDDFITNIVNFDNENQLTPDLRDYMLETYLSRSEYNYNAADRASKACGPLLQWVDAQIQYSLVIDKIAPLKGDVLLLEDESTQTKARLLAIDEMINELQESIEKFKDDYSSLIRETENIKTEMNSIEKNVQRSLTLVENLTDERVRWSNSIQQYDKKYQLLIGDSLLSAAFLTYGGPLDQQGRASSKSQWKALLTNVGVEFNPNLRFIDFFDFSLKCVEWQSLGLPNDELFFENITIMEKTRNVPFIIDPLGQIIPFLQNSLKPKKLVLSSFLDSGFTKILENSLRFGGSLIVQDAENYDPIISRLLSKDFQIIGGRRLIKIGDHEIDCASDFRLFLHSRDPSLKISSFVAARTTIIDFTITEGGLETQALNLVLASRQPEVEKSRSDLVRLNGEYKIRLKRLEMELLKSLSESTGNLLENDDLITTLEKLKVEAKEIEKKMADTANVMANVDNVLAAYQPLARNTSQVFSLINKFESFNRFYQFSLDTYLEHFKSVLNVERQNQDLSEVSVLILNFYKEVFANISLGLLQKDRVVLGLSMSLLYLKEKENLGFIKFACLLLQAIGLQPLELVRTVRDAFDNIGINVNEHTLKRAVLEKSEANKKALMNELDGLDSEIYPLVNAALESDSSLESISNDYSQISRFLFTGFGPYSSKYDLDATIKMNNNKPMILVSAQGYDATFQVKLLAQNLGISLEVLAMGSKEAVDIADSYFSGSTKRPKWLLLQNIQASPEWLSSLEKKVENQNLDDSFRLFLTCNLSSVIPTTLVRSSVVLTFENAPGVRTIMRLTEKNIDKKFTTSKPVEKKHLYFLLCWYHAIIQDRLRFIPESFTQIYDFNDSDFECAIFVIDQWFEVNSNQRTNIAPESIDWEAFRVLIGDIIYGGKAVNSSDAEYLRMFSDKLFSLDSFDHNFNMVDNEITSNNNINLAPPDGSDIEDYKKWIEELPELEPPSWLGLRDETEKLAMQRENVDVSRKVVSVLNSLHI